MPKTKEEILAKFKDLWDIIEDAAQDPDARLHMRASFAEISIETGLNDIFTKIVKSYENPEDAYKDLKDIVPGLAEGDIEKHMEAAYGGTGNAGKIDDEKFMKRQLALKDIMNPSKHKDKPLSHEEKMQMMAELCKDDPEFIKENNKNMIDGVGSMLANGFRGCSREQFTDLIGKLMEMYPQIDLEPSEESLEDPLDTAVRLETPTKKDEIAKLKEAHKDDADFIGILEDADEICTIGSNTSTSTINPVFEDAGNYVNNINKNDAEKYLNDLGFHDGKEITVSRQTIMVANDDTPEFKQPIMEKIVKDKFTLTDETKDVLMQVYEIMKDGTLSFHLDTLTDRREALEKAIDSGDKEKIENEVAAYRDVDEKYTKVIDLLKSVNDFNFPMNLSSGRRSQIPLKYRNDVEGASLLRSIGDTIDFCKNNGVSFMDLISDPVQATIDLCCQVEATDPVLNYCKEHSVSDVLQMATATKGQYNRERSLLEMKSGEMGVRMGNGLSGIALYSNEPGKANADAFMCFAALTSDALLMPDSLHENFTADAMTDLIISEPEDRNVKTFFKYKGLDPHTMQAYKPFDAAEYLNSGKTTPEGVLLRLIEAKETVSKMQTGSKMNPKKELEEAIKKTTAMVRERENELSNAGKRALRMLEENTTQKFTATDRSALESEASVKKVRSSDRGIAVDVNRAMNSLYAMSQDYKNRWFFQKWFGPETNRLDDSIKLMTAIMKEELGEGPFNEKWDQASKGTLENGKDMMISSCGETTAPVSEPVKAGDPQKVNAPISEEELNNEPEEIDETDLMNTGFISDKKNLVDDDELTSSK